MNILDTNMEFIENSIDIGIKISEARDRGETKYVNDFNGPWGNDLTDIYFVGRGLCLDVKDDIGSQEVITLSLDTETFGYFSGGHRRLLSIRALRKLQRLMDLNKINYQHKHTLL
jgi:hypothetical protein